MFSPGLKLYIYLFENSGYKDYDEDMFGLVKKEYVGVLFVQVIDIEKEMTLGGHYFVCPPWGDIFWGNRQY